MAFFICVDDIGAGDALQAQRFLKFFEIGGFIHPVPLLGSADIAIGGEAQGKVAVGRFEGDAVFAFVEFLFGADG